MKRNMGIVDSILRVLIAVVIIGIYFAGYISGTLAGVLLLLSLVFILTGLTGFCPLYRLFGIGTHKKENKQ